MHFRPHQEMKLTPDSGNPSKTKVICSGNHYSHYTTTRGESANAVPHYQKFCSRDSHIWGIRKGQPSRRAMAEPRFGGTTFLIMVSPLPGKYELELSQMETSFPGTWLDQTVLQMSAVPCKKPLLPNSRVLPVNQERCLPLLMIST